MTIWEIIKNCISLMSHIIKKSSEDMSDVKPTADPNDKKTPQENKQHRSYKQRFWTSMFYFFGVAAILVIVVFAFYGGMRSELVYKVSEDVNKMTGIFSEIYEKKKTAAQLKKVQGSVLSFVNLAKPAISKWKQYHAQPNSSRFAGEAHEIASNVVAGYRDFQTELKVLSPTWKIYAYYYYAYLQMILADINEFEANLNNALDEIKKIEIIQKTKLKIEDREWLTTHKLDSNTKTLKVQSYAIKWRLAKKSDSPSELSAAKNLAIKSLQEIGGKNALKGSGLDIDRLTKDVYDATYGINAESKKQGITQFDKKEATTGN